MSQVTITLLFLLFAIVMFMWEKIPLGLTSMTVSYTHLDVYKRQKIY